MSAPRCKRCHRILKDAASITCGLGPTCFSKLTGRSLPRETSPRKPAAVQRPLRRTPKKSPAPGGTISIEEWEAMLHETEESADETAQK